MIYETVLRPYGDTGKFRPKRVRVDGYISPSHHPDHRRNYVARKREECIHILGKSCVRCGFSEDIRALQIDHVNGGGHAERKKFSGGASYLYILKNIDSDEYQVLCANCNIIKRAEEQECPRLSPLNRFSTDPTELRLINNMTCFDVTVAIDEDGYYIVSGTYYSDDPDLSDDELYELRKKNNV